MIQSFGSFNLLNLNLGSFLFLFVSFKSLLTYFLMFRFLNVVNTESTKSDDNVTLKSVTVTSPVPITGIILKQFR